MLTWQNYFLFLLVSPHETVSEQPVNSENLRHCLYNTTSFIFLVLVMAETTLYSPSSPTHWNWRHNKLYKGTFSVTGIMLTLLTYSLLQEKIVRVPYGVDKDYFKYSLFPVCVTTSAVSAVALLASKKALDPAAPIYKYCAVPVSNILTTTCQYEAFIYISFPAQTIAKCTKMIPVMVWGTLIMQKRYQGTDYLLAFSVTFACSVFILYPAGTDISPYGRGRENTVWGILLMSGYLGCDGFKHITR